jgi:hypothetical protein
MHFSWSSTGWRLWVRHRHTTGLFSDCDADDYEGLSRAELQDVLVTIVDLWGPLSEPGQGLSDFPTD